jgi:hypothetical protein
MADTFYANSGIIGSDIDNVSTDQKFSLGTRLSGNDGTMFVYVQANGAITQYDCVAIDESYQAAPATKALVDVGHRIGFAQVAFADNDYGWVALSGSGSNMKVRVQASCAADVPLYTSATGGILDDASTSQTKIDGVVAVTAVTTAGATPILATWPKSTTF